LKALDTCDISVYFLFSQTSQFGETILIKIAPSE